MDGKWTPEDGTPIPSIGDGSGRPGPFAPVRVGGASMDRPRTPSAAQRQASMHRGDCRASRGCIGRQHEMIRHAECQRMDKGRRCRPAVVRWPRWKAVCCLYSTWSRHAQGPWVAASLTEAEGGSGSRRAAGYAHSTLAYAAPARCRRHVTLDHSQPASSQLATHPPWMVQDAPC